MRPRGLTIVEALISLSILGVLSLVAYQSFTASASQAAMTREHTVALLLATTLSEEIKAHPFGHSAPHHWPGSEPFSGNWEEAKKSGSVERVNASIRGKHAPMLFHQQLTFERGVFLDAKPADPKTDWDKATIKITWQQRAGGNEKAPGRHSLTVDLDLWRPY